MARPERRSTMITTWQRSNSPVSILARASSGRMLTPIFHPNFDPVVICVGDHWTAGERLVDLIVRIGEMIAFQAYNIKSPLDGEAAMWLNQNSWSLPTDKRNLRPPELD